MTLSGKRRLLLPIPAVAAAAVAAVAASAALADPAALSWTNTDPAALGDQSLSDVEAIAADDVWAVGVTKPNGAGEPVAIHWNGEQWRDTDPPGGRSLNDIEAVDGEVWAVGDADATTTLAARWDGAAWETVPSPEPSVPDDQEPYLTGVDGAAADDVWAVGSSSGMSFPGESTAFMQHWDGREWTLQDVPLPSGVEYSSLDTVRVFAADDAWAVGQTIDDAGVIAPLLLHWDGQAWSPRELSIPEASVNDIAVTADGRIWLAGAVFPDSDPFGGTPLLVVGDGTDWTELEVPSTERWLSAIAPSGDDEVMAVGDDGEGFLVVTSDGATVTRQDAPTVEPGTDYASLTAVDRLPDTDTVWTVGFLNKFVTPVAAHTS